MTGGAGFIGSHFLRMLLSPGRGYPARLVNVDLLTYAGDLRRLGGAEADPRYRFVRADVADAEALRAVFAEERPQAVVHFAAESHVTRSETDPDLFHRTNVRGTAALLDAALAAGVERFIHISTDEVYGPILEGSFGEEDKLAGDQQATSPYARSKALADDLARSYAGRLPVVVLRPTNAFGPWQFPEKALARWVSRALRGRSLPVWGDGLYVRQWLAASDLAAAVALMLQAPDPAPVYNVGVAHEPEITNLALARFVLEHLGLPESRLEMTAYDRPGHDRRYCVDGARIGGLGWRPGDVWARLAATVDWYAANRWWWEPLVGEAESIYAGRGA
ncbi:MAG TPA: NAD-dependent epimerase/dehydratase family protein [Actinomycetota bacterium]